MTIPAALGLVLILTVVVLLVVRRVRPGPRPDRQPGEGMPGTHWGGGHGGGAD